MNIHNNFGYKDQKPGNISGVHKQNIAKEIVAYS